MKKPITRAATMTIVMTRGARLLRTGRLAAWLVTDSAPALESVGGGSEAHVRSAAVRLILGNRDNESAPASSVEAIPSRYSARRARGQRRSVGVVCHRFQCIHRVVECRDGEDLQSPGNVSDDLVAVRGRREKEPGTGIPCPEHLLSDAADGT